MTEPSIGGLSSPLLLPLPSPWLGNGVLGIEVDWQIPKLQPNSVGKHWWPLALDLVSSCRSREAAWSALRQKGLLLEGPFES